MQRLMACSMLVASAFAWSDSQKHYHNGKLAKYDIGAPSLLLSSSDEARLRSGRPVQQALDSDDGASRRLIMVQDIKAPTSVVLGRIIDLDNYPKMVSGCNSLETYGVDTKDGITTYKSKYEISAVHLKLTYFVEQHFDPKAGCMTFHLDYTKRSDLDDTVGYWYVEPTGRTTSRVYYSCECKLRGWVPGPVYNLLTKEALTKATTWVERESVRAFRESKSGFLGEARRKLVDGMREGLDNLKLPPPPPFAQRLLDGQMEALPSFLRRPAPESVAASSATASRLGLGF